MYSADGIGRTGHRLLALTLTVVGSLGLGLVASELTTPSDYTLIGLGAMTVAFLAMGVSLWVTHRPTAASTTTKPRAAKVPTPPLDPASKSDRRSKAKTDDGTLFEYDDVDAGPSIPHPDDGFEGTVPRGTVIDERPPPPPVPDVVQTRHDFTTKYTQDTPQVREILTTSGPQRPQRVTAQLADPGVHPTQLPPATMRGKCSGCDSLILAPTHRPIELECPACDRVTLLE